MCWARWAHLSVWVWKWTTPPGNCHIARACLSRHTCLGPKLKGLCANTCEGTGQVRQVVWKNITLPSTLALLALHIRVLKIACQSCCWQWLMMGLPCIYSQAYSHQAINGATNKTFLCHLQPPEECCMFICGTPALKCQHGNSLN